MRFFALFRFLRGAVEFSQLDPKTLADTRDVALHQKCHRRMIAAGIIGGALGIIFGIVIAIAMFLHPPHEAIRGDDIYIIIFQCILMPIAGILTGASWVCSFFPAAFYRGPIGQSWMKMLGTKSVAVARVVTVLVALLGVGLVVFFVICLVTGHV